MKTLKNEKENENKTIYFQPKTAAGVPPSVAGSAVARGGAGGARAPPVFLLESKNRPV